MAEETAHGADEGAVAAASDGGLTRSAKRTVVASFVGSTFEWFDFGIYGTTAAVVFNEVFFSSSSPTVGTLLALVTTAVGFVTRPVGGIIFGHFGDRIGRKRLLVLTMLIMGVPTFLIGLLPSSATIGVAAPVVLLLLRLLQGIGLGGEYAGAALATLESVPTTRRGFFGAIPQIGNPVGGLLASAMVLVASSVFPTHYAQWAWRIPFLLSAVLLAYALYVRLHMFETADFAALRTSEGVERIPVLTVLREHTRRFLLCLGSRAADAIAGNVGGGVVTAYVVTYLGLPRNIALTGTIIQGLLAIPYMLWIGRLSDGATRRRYYLLGLVGIAVGVFPLFLLLGTKVAILMWIGMSVFWLLNVTQFAVQSAFFAEVFPTEVRYTAISLVYQLSAIVGGLTAPAAYAILIATHGSPWLLAGIVAAVALLCAGFAALVRPAVAQARHLQPQVN